MRYLIVTFCVFFSAHAGFWDTAESEKSTPSPNLSGKNSNVLNSQNSHEGRKIPECATKRLTCENFAASVVKGLNKQINMELTASYVYQAMAIHFARDDVALHGFSKYFSKNSEDEQQHGRWLMEYVNKRGGDVILQDIKKPNKIAWKSGLDALKDALDLEHKVNSQLLDLHWKAQQENDPHLQDYLESTFLTEQVDSIKSLADKIKTLSKMSDTPLGEYLYDKELKS